MGFLWYILIGIVELNALLSPFFTFLLIKITDLIIFTKYKKWRDYCKLIISPVFDHIL